VVCRYGGEEFLVILLGAGAREAWHHAERIRVTIAATEFANGASQPLGCVSISGGVAAFPDDAPDATTLVALADRALYAAKGSGRNRISLGSDVAEHARGPSAHDASAGAGVSQGVRATNPVITPIPVTGPCDVRATAPVLTPVPEPIPTEANVESNNRSTGVRRKRPAKGSTYSIQKQRRGSE
jgi:hypothetical protein